MLTLAYLFADVFKLISGFDADIVATDTGKPRTRSSAGRNTGARKSHKKKKTKTALVKSRKTPAVCTLCKKRFARQSMLDRHNKLVHSTEVKYGCNERIGHSDNSGSGHLKIDRSHAASATDADPTVITDNTHLGRTSMFNVHIHTFGIMNGLVHQ